MTPIHLREGFYAVEVPEGANGFEIDNPLSHGDIVYYTGNPSIYNFRKIGIPPGTWGIVCTSKEVTEEIAATIVECDNRGYKHYWEDRGFVPLGFNARYKTANESLTSLLTSKRCDSNKTYLILKKTL